MLSEDVGLTYGIACRRSRPRLRRGLRRFPLFIVRNDGGLQCRVAYGSASQWRRLRRRLERRMFPLWTVSD